MMRVAVELQWRQVKEVLMDGGRLVFPHLPGTAGLYRLRLVGSTSASTYIGETANLKRRAAGYRGGYAGQVTNARMNRRMREHLSTGGAIEMSIATAAVLAVDSETDRPLDLSRKASRLLAEAAALHAVPDAEPLENLPGIGDVAPG